MSIQLTNPASSATTRISEPRLSGRLRCAKPCLLLNCCFGSGRSCTRGRAREALHLFESVLEAAPDAPARLGATAYVAATQFAQVAGEYSAAYSYGMYALQLCRELDDPVCESRVLGFLAI